MFNRILLNPTWPAHRPALIRPNATTTWGGLRDLVGSLGLDEAGLTQRRIGLSFRPDPTCLATLAVLDRIDCDTFLMDGSLGREEAVRLGAELRLDKVLFGGESPPDVLDLDPGPSGTGRSSLTILTSGTTGKPKAARHTWDSLCRPVRVNPQADAPRWMLVYRPHLYAGLQVMLQCLVNGGTLVVPDSDATPAEVAELMRSARVEFMSATPSYWRRLFLFADHATLGEVPLAQITVGGEVVDQQLLDRLARVFPATRITHIYATTELGRCFAVSDGKAGFPARYLSEPTPDGIEMRVDDGELVVRSANAMQTYDGGTPGGGSGSWGYHTGDMIDVVDDRAYFVGRRSDMINVGGNKVHPVEVERVVRAVPGVSDVCVYGKQSSIAGELVAADVLATEGTDLGQLRGAIVAACIAQLGPVQRPRLINFVTGLTMEASGKTKRRLSR